MQQQGIRSVMSQSPMPGQAPMPGQPMPGMMPSQSGSKPGLTAFVPSLVGLEIPQMLQIFADPNSPIPKNRVLAAIVEKQKEMAARRSVQNQMAMQQNAGQQGTVADAVVAQAAPVMAAQGGEMQGYAGGGAVAFKDAGVVPPGLMNPDVDEDGLPRSKNEREQIIDYNNRIKAAYQQRAQAQARQAQLAQATAPKPAYPEEAKRRLEQFYQSTGREKAVQLGTPLSSIAAPAPAPVMSPEAQSLTNRQGPRGIMAVAPRTAGQPQQRPQVAPVAATAPAPGIRSTLTPDEQRIYDERKATLEGRKALPSELLEGRAGLASLMQQNLAEQQAEAKAFSDEARAARDAALARAQRDIFSDPMALLGIAGAIDTRKGQGMGSFARSLSGIMGQRESAAEAARKEYATAQGTMRTLQANIRQGNMLEAQRLQAIRENDFGRVNQIDDAIAQNAAERAKLERDVQNKAFEQAIEGRKVAATERTARAAEINAGKPSEMDIALNRPEEYARVLKARAEATQARVSPEDRRAATIERYADNWEKLDMMQKNELAKQGVTNFQQYVRMRDQMTAGNTGAAGAKTMTMADVQATAKSSGKTVDEVKRAAVAAGYTVQ